MHTACTWHSAWLTRRLYIAKDEGSVGLIRRQHGKRMAQSTFPGLRAIRVVAIRPAVSRCTHRTAATTNWNRADLTATHTHVEEVSGLNRGCHFRCAWAESILEGSISWSGLLVSLRCACSPEMKALSTRLRHFASTRKLPSRQPLCKHLERVRPCRCLWTFGGLPAITAATFRLRKPVLVPEEPSRMTNSLLVSEGQSRNSKP